MSSAYIPKDLRERLAEQGRHRCGYCLTQEMIVGMPMEVDHLIPVSLGGPTEESNLWLACPQCNACKGNRIAAQDPETGETVRLFNPRTQIWNEHFAWSDAGVLVSGKTTVGRSTIRALRLNRPALVEARRAWVAVGWHPPGD